MQLKSGVDIKGIHEAMRPVLKAADRIWKKHNQELVVTAGLDGTHSAGSLHPFGKALDFRTRYFSSSETTAVANELRTELGTAAYDVIVHSTHIHVEFDPYK